MLVMFGYIGNIANICNIANIGHIGNIVYSKKVRKAVWKRFLDSVSREFFFLELFLECYSKIYQLIFLESF